MSVQGGETSVRGERRGRAAIPGVPEPVLQGVRTTVRGAAPEPALLLPAPARGQTTATTGHEAREATVRT
jgi:hypothetical protein